MKNPPKIQIVYDYKHESDATHPGTVWVRVYVSRTCRKYVSTGVRVLPEQWSNDFGVIRHPEAARLNGMIREQVEKAKSVMQEAVECPIHRPTPTAKEMKVDRTEASFLVWLEKRISECELRPGTTRHHRTVLASLERFGKIKRFDDVTAKNIKEWISFLKQRETSKMINGTLQQFRIDQVTIYGYFKRLRKWINEAIKEGLLPMNTLIGVEVAKGTNKEREFLTDEEVEAWCSTIMPNAHLADARDRFIVQMGTGLAFADMMETDFTKTKKYGKHLTLQGRRVKTGEQFFLVILPMARAILEKWNWKIPPISNQKYNAFLKAVSGICGIDKNITSHVGRHTYATQCLSHGVRIEAVQRTLGHSSIKTTQIYAKLVDKSVIEAFDNYK